MSAVSQTDEAEAYRAPQGAFQGRGADSRRRSWAFPTTWSTGSPFPAPGLAIRMIGDVTKDRSRCSRRRTTSSGRRSKGRRLRPYLAVLRDPDPHQDRGGHGRRAHLRACIAVRAVESQDGMTADWASIPYEVLDLISRRIINEVPGVNRVVLDISSKPPSTIEWE